MSGWLTVLDDLIRQQRITRGWSRAEMARRLMVTRAHISAIEQGKRNPSAELLVKLTNVLTWPASEWLDSYLKSGPGPSEMCRLAGQLLDDGQTAPAEKIVQAALRVSRSQYEGRYNSQVYHVLGKIYVQKQDFESAHVWFTQMLAALNRTPASLRKATALYNCGLTAALAGAGHVASLTYIREAREIFALLNREEEVQLSWYTEGKILLELRSYHEALAAYNAVRTLRDHPVLGYEVRLGELICRWATDGPETILRPMKQLLRASTTPDVQGRILHNLGVVHRQTGNLATALATIREALDRHPDAATRQYAASLAEKCLIEGLSDDWSEAARTHEEFRSETRQHDRLDLAAMSALGWARHWPSLAAPPILQHSIRDNYERRFTTAWQLVTSTT